MKRPKRATYIEQKVIEAALETTNRTAIAAITGFSANQVRGALERPFVVEEIRRRTAAILWQDLLPVATRRLERILGDDTIKPADHNQAIKIVYAYTLGTSQGGQTKELHEMDGTELAEAAAKARAQVAALERMASDKAKPVSPAIDLF